MLNPPGCTDDPTYLYLVFAALLGAILIGMVIGYLAVSWRKRP